MSRKVVEGTLNASNMRIGIVVSRFNSLMTEALLEGAIDTIVRHGGNERDIPIVRVPGSFELPLAASKLIERGGVDAVVALGAVIRGATSHYDYVCMQAAKGISDVMSEKGVPIAFGVITTDTIEQAIERSGSKAGNKGAEAALAAIEMVNVIRAIEGGMES